MATESNQLPPELQRALELERLDDALKAIWETAILGTRHAEPVTWNQQLKAIDRVLKIVDTRAKLLGLYQQRASEVAQAESSFDMEARLRELRKLPSEELERRYREITNEADRMLS